MTGAQDGSRPRVEWSPAGLVRPAGRVMVGGVPALSGYVVAVAGDVRVHPLASVLAGQGARAVSVQATCTQPQGDAVALAAATARAVSQPADEVIVSSAYGLRRWVAAARAAGLGAELQSLLSSARLLAGNPRAADALRELGHDQIWSAPSNTTEDLFAYLLAHRSDAPVRVVAQVDHEPVRELVHALAESGADVVEVLTIKTGPPRHRDVLHRLADQIMRRQIDAVLMCGASCGEHLLEQTDHEGITDRLLAALREDAVLVCLGPLGSAPFVERGLTPLTPPRPLLAELVDVVLSELPNRSLRSVVDGHRIEIRSEAVVVGGNLVPVPAGPLAVLRALARARGQVLSAAEIRAQVPGWSQVDDHAIEMAVSRLRRSLDGTGLEGLQVIQTVVKRGYRLAG